MKNVLALEKLSKNFGRLKAVDSIDLEIPQGSIYGILGPNGSGKSTTLGMVLNVINKSSGDYKWFDEEKSDEARKKIGAILEGPCFYNYLTGEQNLRIVAEIKNVALERIDECLKRVNLYERRKDKFKNYSLGMKQRLAIASALLCDPSVMILDEPTNGLDPQGIAEIRELIISLGREKRTIILASHLLYEVQKVCSHFAVLRKGKLIYSGNVSDVTQASGLVEVAGEDKENLALVLSNCSMLESVQNEKDHFLLKLLPEFSATDINKYLIQNGVILNHLKVLHNDLEKQFLEILKNKPENEII